MPRCTAREERILTLARDLFAEQAALPLDTIDGEFYWRICQEPVTRIFDAFSLLIRPPRSQPDSGPVDWTARGEHLRSRREVWEAFATAHAEELQRLPDPVVGHLVAQERVPMRPASIWQPSDHPLFPGDSVLAVQVRTGEWTGDHVVDVIRRELATNPFLGEVNAVYESVARHHPGPETNTVRITASLHQDVPTTDRGSWTPWKPVEFPCIELVIHLPLPDPAVVAEFYDTTVRTRYRWHQALPGGQAHGQHKDVAIRTWAIGLLMASGLSFFRAMEKVVDLFDEEPVGQGRFNAARTLLLKRVPEARPYVFAAR